MSAYERRNQIQRVARAIDHHIEALSQIPEYEVNAPHRLVHENLLAKAIEEMKGLING